MGSLPAVAREGWRLFRKRHYREAAVLLEQAVKDGDENLHVILAAAYIHADNFINAEGMLARMRSRFPGSPRAAELSAFLHLKAAPSAESALVKYAELAAMYPQSRKIRAVMRRLESARDFRTFQKKALLVDCVELRGLPFFPASVSLPSFSFKRRRVAGGSRRGLSGFYVKAGITLALLASGVLVFLNLGRITDAVSQRLASHFDDEPDKNDLISIDDLRYSLLDRSLTGKPLHFYLDDDSVRADFSSARRLAARGNYNEALIILNRIIGSNAGLAVRDRAEYLVRYIRGVEDRPATDIPYAAIAKEPRLYTGCMIRWKGAIANYREKKGKSSFTLLVDYRDGRMAGAVEVFLPEIKNSLSNGKAVEVKGVFVNVIGRERTMYVQAEEAY